MVFGFEVCVDLGWCYMWVCVDEVFVVVEDVVYLYGDEEFVVEFVGCGCGVGGGGGDGMDGCDGEKVVWMGGGYEVRVWCSWVSEMVSVMMGISSRLKVVVLLKVMKRWLVMKLFSVLFRVEKMMMRLVMVVCWCCGSVLSMVELMVG